jgi:hypothetical protein
VPYAYSSPGAAPLTGSVAVTGTRAMVVDASINRRILTLYNAGHGTVYIGNIGVLTTTGWPILPGNSFETIISGAVYVINDGIDTGDLRYWDEHKPGTT